jgi:flagellar assembly factor FliW
MNGVMPATEAPVQPPPPQTASVVSFAEGLVGLPGTKRFEIESSESIAPLLRIRGVDGPEVSFLVVDPRLVIADYHPRVGPEALAAVGLAEGQPALLLAIAHIAPKIEDCTANLQAPLLINPVSMRGLQVILEPGSFSAAHPLVSTAA